MIPWFGVWNPWEPFWMWGDYPYEYFWGPFSRDEEVEILEEEERWLVEELDRVRRRLEQLRRGE